MRSLQRLSHLTQRGDASKASAPAEPVAQHRDEAEFWESGSDPVETAEWLQLLDGGRTDEMGDAFDSSEPEEYDWAAPIPEPDPDDSWPAPGAALDAEPPSTDAGLAPFEDGPFADELPAPVPAADVAVDDVPGNEVPPTDGPLVAAPVVASAFARFEMLEPEPIEPPMIEPEPVVAPEPPHLQVVSSEPSHLQVAPAVARFEMIEPEPVVDSESSHLQVVEPPVVEPPVFEPPVFEAPVTRFEMVPPEIADLVVRDPEPDAPEDFNAPPPRAAEFLPTVVDDLLPPR